MADIDIIDDETLARRVACGAIVDAEAVGCPGGWGVVVRDEHTTRVLVSRHGAARQFARMETLVGYLKRLGVDRFRVDASGFGLKSSPGLADEVAEHDRWFRDQVSKTLDGIESGDVGILTEEEHRARWQRKRADMLAGFRRNA